MRALFTGVLLVLAVLVGCGAEGDSAAEGRDGQRATAAREARQQAKSQAAKRAKAVRRAAAQARRRAARRQDAREARQRARRQAQAEAEAEAAEAATEEEASECDPNYSGACLDPYASDYDCEGGSGDGPAYTGPVVVVGEDRHGLDSDSDGSGCEPY